nr:MAG TPA: hypothetical protein [Caudoviricetes sp.]
MQINGTTLTKRQKALIGGALLREQTRVTDAIRLIDQDVDDTQASERVYDALLVTIDEITNLITLINRDKEAAK